jgi:cytochrome P450
MNAVLLESLRVASLVGPGVPHYTTKEVTVGEYVIPKNTTVFGSLYHVMNDPEHFNIPRVFNPDRFLDANGKFLSEERVAPFGIGKRICLGQTLAEKEFYLFFAGILQQFELNQDETTTLPSYDMNETFPKGLLRNAPQFNLKLRHRLKA